MHETKYSTNATKDLEKTRKYTNELSGVSARTLNPKRTSPIARMISRRFEVILNFVGGIGMYQIIAQMRRKTSKFKVRYLPFRILHFRYLRIT